MRTKTDAIKLLRDTIKRYDGIFTVRAVVPLEGRPNTTRCLYINPKNGATCAVGCRLINPKRAAIDLGGAGILALAARLGDRAHFDAEFLPEYRDYPLDLWSLLQGLHDSSANWTEPEGGALTTMGRDTARGILAYINEATEQGNFLNA